MYPSCAALGGKPVKGQSAVCRSLLCCLQWFQKVALPLPVHPGMNLLPLTWR